MQDQYSCQPFLSSGNETLDKFLGKGFSRCSLNLFEHAGPQSKILQSIFIKTISASSIANGNLIILNFNTFFEVQPESFLKGVPKPGKVKTQLLYKDVQHKSSAQQIKIAWRYTKRSSSPSDSMLLSEQIDFGSRLIDQTDEDLTKKLHVVNLRDGCDLSSVIGELETAIVFSEKENHQTNIICRDLIHPLSSFIDRPESFMRLMYLFRAISRRLKGGMVFVSYDTCLFDDYEIYKQQIYNIADCVVSFHSYETGQNIVTGYKNIDGTLDYVKVPKLNSFGFHFQRELSDWGYRLTRNRRFFVIDELSLPPCDDDDTDTSTKKEVTDIVRLSRKSVQQIGPLEDLRNVAENVIGKLDSDTSRFSVKPRR